MKLLADQLHRLLALNTDLESMDRNTAVIQEGTFEVEGVGVVHVERADFDANLLTYEIINGEED